jgi:hypothetical protein
MTVLDVPDLIRRAHELADNLEMWPDAGYEDSAIARAVIILRSLCDELEAERKRRLSAKDERWK